MSQTKIRIITLLLALLFVMSCFIGCVGSQNNEDDIPDTDPSSGTDDKTPDGGEDTTPPEPTVEDILGFEITKMDKTFNLLYSRYSSVRNDIAADASTGDEIAVKVHERNLNVEETFGVTLNLIDGIATFDTRAEDLQTIQNAIHAGTNDYDLVLGINVGTATMMYTGVFHDLNKIESVNLDHDWWMNNTTETYGIGNRVYGVMGDIGHSYYSNLGLIALNTTLADTFGVEAAHGDLYKMVYDGKWTLDKMIEIGSTYGADNGDGVMTMGEDTFGMVALQVPSRLFMYGFGIDIIKRNADETGVILPDQLDEKTITSYEKLYDVFPKSTIGSKLYMAPSNKNADTKAAFANDKVLMMTAYFSFLGEDVIKNQMTSDYMVMPLPKYDEAQDDYIVPLATTAGMAHIPLTAIDVEDSGKILEYLAYYGSENIVQPYINNTLKLKYASDEKVVGMVEYLIDRSAFTLTQVLLFNCSTSVVDATGTAKTIQMSNMYAFGKLNAVQSPSINSYYQENRSDWQGDLDALFGELK